MKKKEIRIILKPENELVKLHFEKLPKQGEDIIIDHKNIYKIVRVVDIVRKTPIEVYVVEE